MGQELPDFNTYYLQLSQEMQSVSGFIPM